MDFRIKNVPEEKVPGITINNKLTLKSHLKNMCNKASQKLSALVRLTKSTSPLQRKTLLNSFIKSQFSYCPLMFTSKELNKKIKRIHEKISKISFKWPSIYIRRNTWHIKWKDNNAKTVCWWKSKNFWMAIPPIIWMTFSIWGRILITSKTSILLLLMCLEIIVYSTPSFIEQINYGKPCLLT